jgi:hypothetical protein
MSIQKESIQIIPFVNKTTYRYADYKTKFLDINTTIEITEKQGDGEKVIQSVRKEVSFLVSGAGLKDFETDSFVAAVTRYNAIGKVVEVVERPYLEVS